MMRLSASVLLVAVAAAPATAATPNDMLARFEAQARGTDRSFAGFSTERGARLFTAAPQGDWSCASCHGNPPSQTGRHAKTGKSIAPLAPAANPERFTDAAKVEKWFARNCRDVLGRECTAQEKGDITAYVLGQVSAR